MKSPLLAALCKLSCIWNFLNILSFHSNNGIIDTLLIRPRVTHMMSNTAKLAYGEQQLGTCTKNP